MRVKASLHSQTRAGLVDEEAASPSPPGRAQRKDEPTDGIREAEKPSPPKVSPTVDLDEAETEAARGGQVVDDTPGQRTSD